MFGRTIIVITAAAVGFVASGCSAQSTPALAAASAPGTTTVTVSVNQCGAGWTNAVPGQQHFILDNTDTRAGEVLLTDARTAAVFADVEPVAPGTRTDLSIALGSGSYTFRCAMEDESTVVGRPVTIPGRVRQPTAPVSPVTEGDLIAATKSYQGYVSRQIPSLVRLTSTLRTAIAKSDRSAAQKDWLQAHLAYERLGAAYDAFGDLDSAINGLPAGLPGGVHDPGFTGFHRIEYGLWHGESSASLLPRTDALLSAVRALSAEFVKRQIDPLDVSIRAHEITENAVQFELTGKTDFGSHSGLATTRANLDGTQVVVGIIRPLLTSRYPQLPALTAAMTRAENDLDAVRQRTGNGRGKGDRKGQGLAGAWPGISALGTARHERIDSDLSQLSEMLAPVASILEPRRDS